VPTVDVSRVPDGINPVFRPLLWDTHRFNVLKGGAASGKSYGTAEKILYKIVAEKGHRYLIIRKVAKTLRHSVFDLFKAVIASWGMTPLFHILETDMTITFQWNGNQLLFVGLDDVDKLKSIYGITDIWVEEASEITGGDLIQLNLRLRGETAHKKQITLTFNPISVLHWLKRRFFDRTDPDVLTHHSTYKDNRYLDADSRHEIEAIEDPYYRDVYALGNWGVYGNVVFMNYVIEDFPYTENDLENVCQGMDFGFAHASAIERLGFKDGELYVFDECYGKGWTNGVFIEAAREQWGDALYNWEITADSANPGHIKEWTDAQYRVTGAIKGEGSVRYGIDYLGGRRMHIHATRCPNMAREVQSFKRREDKDGNALDAFVEINDDCIAAARYATEYIWGQSHGQLADYSAAALGL